MEPLTVLLLSDFIDEHNTEQIGDKRLIITTINNYLDKIPHFFCPAVTIYCEECDAEMEISECLQNYCEYRDENFIESTNWKIFFTENYDEYLCSKCRYIYDRCRHCEKYYVTETIWCSCEDTKCRSCGNLCEKCYSELN